MTDIVIVVNAGSSSLKFSVYAAEEAPELLYKGQMDGVATRPRLVVQGADGAAAIDKRYSAAEIDDHDMALQEVVNWLRSSFGHTPVVGIGHRIAHGGVEFAAPVAIDEQVVAKLDRLSPLAPLHQPANLAAIRAAMRSIPSLPQVACFDTAFHRTHPALADCFALPRALQQDGVRRYGFHGLSYEFIASALPRVAPEIADGKVVVAHLGSGASMCAMKQRTSIDSTMSFTALDGLPMGTRCGALDPGVVIYLIREKRMTVEQVERLLYQESGLRGLSGISNDVRDLLASHDPAAKFALDFFIYRTARELASLATALEGLDGIVFTAGIGEHSAEVRAGVCARCAWLGVELDEPANRAGATRITTPQSRVSAWIIPTDEELVIAKHTLAVIRRSAPGTPATARRGTS